VEEGDDAGECRGEAIELGGQVVETRLGGGLDVGAAEDVGALHEVAGGDAEAPASECAGDARGSGERGDGDAEADAAVAEHAPDEAEQPGFVADVAHGGRI